jgi:hypothetical protein
MIAFKFEISLNSTKYLHQTSVFYANDNRIQLNVQNIFSSPEIITFKPFKEGLMEINGMIDFAESWALRIFGPTRCMLKSFFDKRSCNATV